MTIHLHRYLQRQEVQHPQHVLPLQQIGKLILRDDVELPDADNHVGCETRLFRNIDNRNVTAFDVIDFFYNEVT